MSNPIRDLILNEPILDVHEHHMPETLLDRDVGLLKLLQQSYPGWTQERPYPLEGQERGEDHGFSDETQWEDLAGYLEGSGSNAFIRTLIHGLKDLYNLDKPEITQENWQELDKRIKARHKDPDWQWEVLTRSNIDTIITDCYADPLLDAKKNLGPKYLSVLRINALAYGWHPDSCEHNGTNAHEFASRFGIQLNSFDDYLNFLEHLLDTLKDRHQVALKDAIAYDRGLQYDPPDEQLARECWGDPQPNSERKKAFGDFIVDHISRLAGEKDIPVQMHLGTANIRGSHPLNVAHLIERHPKTRYLLMHFAYPWSRDLLGMAFVYRNIWLDLTWSFLLSPSHFKLAFHEAIEVLPDESRMMLGGDNWHLEETYAALSQARKLIAEVLEEKVQSGYFNESDALRLGKKILNENAKQFFKL